MRKSIIGAAFTAAVLLVGCSGSSTATEPESRSGTITGSWRPVAVKGVSLDEPATGSWELELRNDRTFWADEGCTSSGGEYSVLEDQVRFFTGANVTVGCGHPVEYRNLLPRVLTYELAGDRLILRGNERVPLLELTGAPPG